MLSKIGFSITLLLFVSFSQYIHRSVWYAGGSVILNYILAIPNFFRQLKSVKGKNINLRGLSKPVRMLLIPFILLTVFIIIYAFANAVFQISLRILLLLCSTGLQIFLIGSLFQDFHSSYSEFLLQQG